MYQHDDNIVCSIAIYYQYTSKSVFFLSRISVECHDGSGVKQIGTETSLGLIVHDGVTIPSGKPVMKRPLWPGHPIPAKANLS